MKLSLVLGSALFFFVSSSAFGGGETFQTRNFSVTAESFETAKLVAEAAEASRRKLALSWLGKELDDWPKPARVTVALAPQPAGGLTSFIYEKGKVTSRTMELTGRRRDILTSGIPHEISHIILSEFFGVPVPRWADEGFAVYNEPLSEQWVYHDFAKEMLSLSRYWSLAKLLAIDEYPEGRTIFYFFGESAALVRWICAAIGHKTFIRFLKRGLEVGWPEVFAEYFGGSKLEELNLRFYRDFVKSVE